MKHDDAELIQRTLEGDEQAFAVLVEKYQEQIHALAWQKIGDFHIAQEITQDAFITAYQKLTTLKQHSRFAGWLYVITSNKCNMWHRKKKPQPQSLEETDLIELEEVYYTDYMSRQREEATNEQRRALVQKLLSKLQESDKTVITLHYLAGLTCEEIGRFLGVSPNTVKSRLHRARNRMRKEEAMIQENLSSFRLPKQMTENIMKEITHLNPTAPTGSKPFVPWLIPAAAAVLVLLLVGAGTQYLYRFQKPYSLHTQSEQTIELVDTQLVMDSPTKPALRTRIGRVDIPGNSDSIGRKPDAPLFAAAQAEESETTKSKRQWIQAKGPEGGAVTSLFTTTRGDMFAGTLSGLYRLSDDGSRWQLVNTRNALSLTAQNNGIGWGPMAERGNTLYLATDTKVLSSADRGETWNSLGEHPGGVPIGMVITDANLRKKSDFAIYLALTKRSEWNNRTETAIFFSKDKATSWELLSNENLGNEIRAIASIDNTFFAGTEKGLFRLNMDGWKHLSLSQTDHIGVELAVRNLTVADDKLYVVIAGMDKSRAIARVKIDIPIDKDNLPEPVIRKPVVVRGVEPVVETKVEETKVEFIQPEQPNIAQVHTFSGWMLFRSDDKGESWDFVSSKKTIMDRNHTIGYSPLPTEGPRKHQFPFTLMGPNSNIKIAATGEKILAIEGEDHSISNDGGETWTPFYLDNEAYSGGNASDVVMLDADTFYRSGAYGIFRTTDGGKTWQKYNNGLAGMTILTLAAMNGSLYATTSAGFFISPDGGESWRPFLGGKGSERGIDKFTRFVKSNGILYIRMDGTYSDQEIGKMKPVFARITPENNDFDLIPGIPDSNKLRGDLPNGFNFDSSGDTFYMEYKNRLFRWKPGTSEWHDIGLIDTIKTTAEELKFDALNPIGLKLAVSGKTVYVGKRDGHLFQSFDEGDTWNNVTAKLPIAADHFRGIGFAGQTVCVATDKGVFSSSNGTDWKPIMDADGTPLIVDRFAADERSLYAQANQKVYQLTEGSDAWKPITPEIPYLISCLDVDGNTLYVGTLGSGVLRFALDK